MKSVNTSTPSVTAADRWYFLGALLFAAYFLVTSIYISCHRLFWFDEVFTTLTTRMADWHTVWRALIEDAADPTPFGYFVVARTFDRLFGPSELGIRLPSALAMAAGMLLTYDCVRRVTDRLHGLIAMAVLTCSYLTYYGYEGRAYALYFLCAAAALWAWMGKRSAILLAVVFFVGVTIHYYLVLCLVPLALEEAYNWRPWRRPSGRVVGAVLGALAALVVLLPQIHASRRVWGANFWARPVGRLVPAMYTEIFPAGLFLLSLVALWVTLHNRSERIAVGPVSGAERTGLFSLAIPIAGYVLAKLVTHAYVDRYLIGLLPGVAVGFSCLVWRHFSGVPRISAGILLLLAGYGVAAQTEAVRHPDHIEAAGLQQERTRAILAMEDELWSKGARYIVIDTPGYLFLEARYYSKHPERYVLWWTLNKAPGAFPHYPMRLWTLDDVKQHSREVAFVDLEPEKLEVLQRAGIRTLARKAGYLNMSYPE